VAVPAEMMQGTSRPKATLAERPLPLRERRIVGVGLEASSADSDAGRVQTCIEFYRDFQLRKRLWPEALEMNPCDPPQSPEAGPVWLDVQPRRILRWMLWLQVAAIVCTGTASAYDTGFYRTFALWPGLEAILYIFANAAPLMLLLGGLCWLVEMLRLWSDSEAASWYLWLEPVIIGVGIFSMLPLVQ
jgi:hypothetical protein